MELAQLFPTLMNRDQDDPQTCDGSRDLYVDVAPDAVLVADANAVAVAVLDPQALHTIASKNATATATRSATRSGSAYRSASGLGCSR